MKRIALFLCCCMLLQVCSVPIHADEAWSCAEPAESVYRTAVGILSWQKGQADGGSTSMYITSALLEQAGTVNADWLLIGMGRLGVSDRYADYLAQINSYVEERYQTPYQLDRAKSTEWHRITLAVLAAGGNPRRAGESGTVDLIADGVYNRTDEAGVGILGKQGINGMIWGLIALDSMCYGVPEDACYSRDDLILSILSRRLDDGGWALSGSVSDPDLTAMAIQALAPYYNSEKEYPCRNPGSAGQTSQKVRDAVDGALEFLSERQREDGGYVSWGMSSCESGVQVLIALCALGINPLTDTRFIKNGQTLYDGILQYRVADGGFSRTLPDGGQSKSDPMVSAHVLCGMAALLRLLHGERRLYDFREEMSAELRQQILDVTQGIDRLNASSGVDEVEVVYRAYLAVEKTERSYISNYRKLSRLLAAVGIAYEPEESDYHSGNAEDITVMQEFTDADRALVDALPADLDTSYRTQVNSLWQKIRNSFDFEGKQSYLQRLEAAKQRIDAILVEVESLKADIREKLYPVESLEIADKATVDSIYRRYQALSEADRALLEPADAEAVLKSKARVDSLWRGWLIAGAALAVSLVLVGTVLVRIRSRRRRRAARAMPESEE